MGAPRVQDKMHERIVSEAFLHFPIRFGAPPFACGEHRHFETVFGVAADLRYHFAAVLFEDAFEEREIFAAAGLFGNLLAQRKMRFVVFCDDEQPRSIFVDAVDDAGAQFAVDAAQRIEPE